MNMPTIHRTITLTAVLTAAAAMPAAAQPAGAETTILASSGVSSFDLSGTGATPAFTVRASRDIGDGPFAIEGGLLVSRPEQQFGDSTLIVPEAQLQYRWHLGRRFVPYVGAGVGAARVSSRFRNTDWDPTISFGGGTRVRLDERVGVFGELRIRGVEWKFTGTTTDVMGGVVWRLGR